MHAEKKRETVEAFKNVQDIVMTTDAGTSLSGKTFIDVNFHWIDGKNLKMKKKTVEVIKVDSKTAVNYRKVTDKVESDHGVNGKVFLKVTLEVI